jgi:LysM repeat protein
MPVLEALKSPNNGKDRLVLSVVGGNAIETIDGPSGTPLEIAQKETSDQISVYVVRDGDSLGTVAEMFGVSVNTIVWANSLSSSRDIHPGQKLLILPISGVKYIVKKGDTIKSIAATFKGDVDEIMNFNDLSASSALKVGDEIIIPNGETAPATPAAKNIAKKGGSLVDASGYFMRPIVGGVRTQGLHGGCACGVDLASKIGTPIYAIADGTVIVSKVGGWHGGYGNYIVVSHPNGTQSLYAHLSENLVSEGSAVVKGQQIAKMGSSGNSTGPHVHFEIRGAKNPF